jgi:predicted enzyme related to lactoylglutathione lyase
MPMVASPSRAAGPHRAGGRALDEAVARLRAAGAAFRNDIVSRPGGRQILIEDPSGNPVELFESV